jgi:hypothetical protein
MVGLAAALGLVELVVFMAVASSAYVGIYNFLSSRMTTSRA